MASSLSRNLCAAILSKFRLKTSFSSASFCTKTLFSADTLAESASDSDSESAALSFDSSATQSQPLSRAERTLENGLDLGIYKAILVGQLGQSPIQKKLKGGMVLTLLSVGTGGIRNNRRPLDNEEPRDYANRCAVQWHRVSVYPDKLGELAVKNFAPGSILYVEGNLETKIYNDPISGLVRRVREIAVRRNGRILYLGKNDSTEKPTGVNFGSVGYF